MYMEVCSSKAAGKDNIQSFGSFALLYIRENFVIIAQYSQLHIRAMDCTLRPCALCQMRNNAVARALWTGAADLSRAR